MTHLIIYINSEQEASAYRVEDNNSYSISFNGNDYESELSQFCKIVMEDLRVASLNEMEKQGGISILIVSNNATNETVRTILGLFLHSEKEDGVLNVNVQELNVIEAKYFLPMIDKTKIPDVKDILQIFHTREKELDNSKEIQTLKANINELTETLQYNDKELQKLLDFKQFILDTIEKKIEQINSIRKNSEILDCICKIDFNNDPQLLSGFEFSPATSEKAQFHSNTSMYNGKKVFPGQCIGIYDNGHISSTYDISSKLRNSGRGRKVMAKKVGKIFFLVADNQLISHGEIVAIIGDFNSLEEAKDFVTQNS